MGGLGGGVVGRWGLRSHYIHDTSGSYNNIVIASAFSVFFLLLLFFLSVCIVGGGSCGGGGGPNSDGSFCLSSI